MPTKEEKIKKLRNYQNSIKNMKLEPKSDNPDKSLHGRTEYHRLAGLLEWAKCNDVDYADHVNFRDGWKLSKELSNIKNFTFRQCCAFLTLLWSSSRSSKNYFIENFNNGNIYKLLDRLIEVMP